MGAKQRRPRVRKTVKPSGTRRLSQCNLMAWINRLSNTEDPLFANTANDAAPRVWSC
jgi:hypothetical protein